VRDLTLRGGGRRGERVPRRSRAHRFGLVEAAGRRPGLCAFLGVLSVVLALATVCPPDHQWIEGIYDDAEPDDVLTDVVSATGPLDDAIAAILAPAGAAAGAVALPDEPVVQVPVRLAVPTRAPPRAVLVIVI